MGAAIRRRHFIPLLLACAFSIESASADLVPSFLWGFASFKGTALPECARLQIFVDAGSGLSASPQPPFTLIAYEASGIATVQTVGSDTSNLWWNVDHAVGAELVLSMADAAGNAGGVGPDSFTVTAGAGTACHPTNPTSPISVTTNTTKVLNTCDVLPLKISGGQKPYSITVAVLGTPAVTNITLGVAFDTYEWVNRAPPNSRIIASVSDASGLYAPATPILTTAGSADLACGGRESTQSDSTGHASAVQSGTAAVTATGTSNPDANIGNSQGSKVATGTIIAGTVGGVVIIGALIAGLLFYLRRRKARAMRPRPFLDDSTPYGGLSMGQVGGAAQAGADEITPFVMTAEQASPYMDHTLSQAAPYRDQASYPPSQATLYQDHSYHNSMHPNVTSEISLGRDHSYHSSQHPNVASETSLGRDHSYHNHIYPNVASETSLGRDHSYHNSLYPNIASETSLGFSTPFTPGPRAASSEGGSTTTFDPYATYTSVRPGSPPSPSIYSQTTTQPAIPGQSGFTSGSVARSGSPPRAGPSNFVVANPGVQEAPRRDMKRRTGPVTSRQSTVYQHEDISDVVELPPAYKARG